jgi:hypothetical protein
VTIGGMTLHGDKRRAMTATLATIDRREAPPADLEPFAQLVQALSPTVGDVQVACNDVRDEDGELVIELEVRLPLAKPAEHHIPGFHADVTGC